MNDLLEVASQRLAGHIGTSEQLAAQTATTAQRLAAVEAAPLRTWREWVAAAIAATWGILPREVVDLLRSLHRGPVREARAVFAAFVARRPGGISWLEGQLWEQGNFLLSTRFDQRGRWSTALVDRVRGDLRRLARLAGIAAGEGDLALAEARLADGHAGVPASPATFGRLARYWAALADQKGEEPLPDLPAVEDGPKALALWAGVVLDQAALAEGDWAPRAGVEDIEDDDGQCVVSLWWDGTWTQGRWVRVRFTYSPAGFERSFRSVVGASVDWSSGTGQPSRFLEVEELLTELDFIYQPAEPTPPVEEPELVADPYAAEEV